MLQPGEGGRQDERCKGDKQGIEGRDSASLSFVVEDSGHGEGACTIAVEKAVHDRLGDAAEAETSFGEPELVHPFTHGEEVVVLGVGDHGVHALVGEINGVAAKVVNRLDDALGNVVLPCVAFGGNEVVVFIDHPVVGVEEEHRLTGGVGLGGCRGGSTVEMVAQVGGKGGVGHKEVGEGIGGGIAAGLALPFLFDALVFGKVLVGGGVGGGSVVVGNRRGGKEVGSGFIKRGAEQLHEVVRHGCIMPVGRKAEVRLPCAVQGGQGGLFCRHSMEGIAHLLALAFDLVVVVGKDILAVVAFCHGGAVERMGMVAVEYGVIRGMAEEQPAVVASSCEVPVQEVLAYAFHACGMAQTVEFIGG